MVKAARLRSVKKTSTAPETSRRRRDPRRFGKPTCARIPPQKRTTNGARYLPST
jgi:hypothetical protein